MRTETRGVVATAKGAPVTVETILVPDPGPGEAVVAVKACGVCHTDLHYREGGINDDFPFLLGHEAAGIVESVGAGVTDLAPGRLRRPELAGGVRGVPGLPARPPLVLLQHPQRHAEDDAGRRDAPLPRARHRRLRRADAGGGRPVHQGQPRRPPRGGRAARLRRHGRHRRRHVHRAGRPGRLGGRLRLRRRRVCRRRRVEARRGGRHHRRRQGPAEARAGHAFGATHTVDAGTTDPVEAIKGLTGGNGADVCIEAVGNPAVMEQAFLARDLAGTLVQVGVPTPDMRIDLPMIEFFGRGGALKPSWYGDCLPSRDFPMLVDLYLDGRLDLDRFVSETIGIEQVEEAFARMQRGEVLRSVVVL